MSRKKIKDLENIMPLPPKEEQDETEKLLDKDKLDTLDEATKRAEAAAKEDAEMINNLDLPANAKRIIEDDAEFEEFLKDSSVGAFIKQVQAEKEAKKNKDEERDR